MPVAAGTRLGPYEVRAPLGAGGMGEVYVAHDLRLGRDVALKVLPERLTHDPEALERFEAEARAVAALSHPNILALHDFGHESGRAYAVTELLAGDTLRERLRAGPVPLRKALDWAVQIALGLSAAHERGIVHRDLKPENLFVTHDGRVKILDFGLAHQGDETPPADETSSPTLGRPTTPSLVVGTAGYMAPEQVRGEAADTRCDLFAFGCVLYETLCGRRAFQHPTAAETMTAILREDPVPLEATAPQVPPAVVGIVVRCLEKNAAERFQSARDLAFALGSVSSAAFSSAHARAPRPGGPGRSAWQKAGAALAAGLLVGATLGFALAARRGPAPAPPEAPDVRYLTSSGQDSEPTASPDGRLVAFTSTRDGRPRLWLKQLASGEETPLSDGPDSRPRFSPDGAALMFARREANGSALYAMSALGGTPRRLVRDALEGDWSPDGRRVVLVRPGERPTLVVSSVDAGDEVVLATAEDAWLWCPRWSPDGQRVAVLEGGVVFGTRGAVLLADLASRARTRLAISPGRGVPSALAWASPATLLVASTEAVTGAAGRVAAHDLGANSQRLLFATPTPIRSFDVLPGGRLVVDAVMVRQNLREWPLRSGQAYGEGRWLTRGSSVDRQPTYRADGDTIAFSSDRSGNLDVWAVSAQALSTRRLTHDAADDYDPAFTPDGQRLLWSSRRGGHFEVWQGDADGGSPRRLTSDGVDAQNASVARDGRWLLYSSADPRKAGLWKVALAGGEATRLVEGTAVIPELAPDGKHVAYLEVRAARRSLRVVSLERHELLLEVPLPARDSTDVTLGRARWLPGHRLTLAFLGVDEDGRPGIWLQDLVSGRDTSATRRRLGGLERDAVPESFAFSPDGSHLVAALRERHSSLLLVGRLSGLP